MPTAPFHFTTTGKVGAMFDFPSREDPRGFTAPEGSQKATSYEHRVGRMTVEE